MKSRTMWILCAALAAPFAWGSEARAAEPTADVVTQQRALFEQGNARYDERRWAEARDAYLAAWKLKRSYDVAANLGDVELVLGDAPSAAEHLAYALREFPAGGKPALRETLTKRFEEARAKVGTLVVRTDVEGARVFVDGTLRGLTPLADPVFVEPGAHVISVEHEGYETQKMTAQLGAGGTIEKELQLKRKAAGAPPTAMKVPETGEAPLTKLPETTAASPAARSWVPVIALGAASVVGLGVAVGFTVASNGASADAHRFSDVLAQANEQCIKPGEQFAETCTQTSHAASRAGTMGDLAFGSYIVSSGLAIAAIAAAVWPTPQKSTATRVRVVPSAGPGTAGIIAVGAW
ncbi:PEGA domain-containing protein [Sorangium sp. So ce375]|uniref:PEGA domain-containing protein n=1 Tax=Sorangium sp. So ce375 TaxID=3133306 RepID=UPI003F5CACC5